jgi:hypothetical protein
MTERIGQADGTKNVRSLSEAVRRVRLVATERSDVIADLAAAERARLQLLAEELADVFKEVPQEVDFFALAVTRTDPPRLWIDMTSHVVMGRDRRTYRFLKDTRLGRSVIRETADLGQMADTVTDYIAERLIEREQAIEADWVSARGRARLALREAVGALAADQGAAPAALAAAPVAATTAHAHRAEPAAALSGVAATDGSSPSLGWGASIAFVVGSLVGAGALLLYMVR